MKDIYTLGIETSCDETAASIVLNGRKILSNVISTQIDIHKLYGGVVPEIASRKHVEFVLPVINEAIIEAGITKNEIDVIGVTYGPGLVGALIVGLSAAKAMAYTLQKSLVGVHHIEGHISANFLQYPDLQPPFICLVASGGHSNIVQVKDYGQYEVIGRTRDDAAGEAFDKISRALGLGYPGGPAIDKASKSGNNEAFNFPRVRFKGSLDFSFSGLKTSVLNYLNNSVAKGEVINVPDVCASFQKAVVDILVENTIKAVEASDYKKIALAGGVASNSYLKKCMKEAADKAHVEFFCPDPILCTDNAAMIGCAAYYQYLKGTISELNLNANPRLAINER